MTKLSTLAYLVKGNQVLLGLKKRGFGEGKLNGYGGKVDIAQESVVESVKRELQEEAGVNIQASDNEVYAKLDFWMGNELKFVCYVFVITSWKHDPVETEEMQPLWVPIAELPLDRMWVDDPHWLPQVLAGEKLVGGIYLSEDGATLLKADLKVVPKINTDEH